MLSWLLGEDESDAVRSVLAGAELVLASDLTLIECERVVIRAMATGGLNEAQAGDRRAMLRRVSEHWTTLALVEEISDRARTPFPEEPVRTLDAIHLATAVVSRKLVPEIRLLSLDEHIRSCGRALGLEVLPL